MNITLQYFSLEHKLTLNGKICKRFYDKCFPLPELTTEIFQQLSNVLYRNIVSWKLQTVSSKLKQDIKLKAFLYPAFKAQQTSRLIVNMHLNLTL